MKQSNRFAGVTQDRCLLYVFRCAVYFAETENPEPEKLKCGTGRKALNPKYKMLYKLSAVSRQLRTSPPDPLFINSEGETSVNNLNFLQNPNSLLRY